MGILSIHVCMCQHFTENKLYNKLTNRFAEMDSICEFFTKYSFTRVPRHFEQKETGVTFRQEVIRRIVFVKNLHRKIPLSIYIKRCVRMFVCNHLLQDFRTMQSMLDLHFFIQFFLIFFGDFKIYSNFSKIFSNFSKKYFQIFQKYF